MKYTIRLKPSNKLFDAGIDKTVLESAFSEGVHLEHSCKNGRCDSCSAVLVSGQVQLENGDVIESGEFLTCNSLPLSALEIEMNYCPELAGLSCKTVPLKLNTVKKLNRDILQLFFRLPPTAKFEYLSGQYVDLTYKGVRRPYSIANAYNEGDDLEFHIKRVDGGVMSAHLFEGLEVNTLMRAYGPSGTFFVRESDAPIAFLVTGTGFAPAKAMIESLLLQKGSGRDICLLWGARKECDLYSEEPKKWAEDYKNFNYVPVLSRPSESWGGAIGYVQSAFLDIAENLSGFHVYACGSPVMIESARSLLIEGGLNKTNFYSDAFVATIN